MKTYVLDVLENILNEEQANQYYYKAFIEMSELLTANTLTSARATSVLTHLIKMVSQNGLEEIIIKVGNLKQRDFRKMEKQMVGLMFTMKMEVKKKRYYIQMERAIKEKKMRSNNENLCFRRIRKYLK